MLSPTNELDLQTLPGGAIYLTDGYFLLRARDRRPSLQGGTIATAIRYFFQGRTANFNDSHVRVCRWARLLLPNGQIVRTAWKENQKQLQNVRMSRFVKVCIYSSLSSMLILTAYTLHN